MTVLTSQTQLEHVGLDVFSHPLGPVGVPLTKLRTRTYERAINITEFCHDILSSGLITHPSSTLSDLVDCYNSIISQLLNKHGPL